MLGAMEGNLLSLMMSRHQKATIWLPHTTCLIKQRSGIPIARVMPFPQTTPRQANPEKPDVKTQQTETLRHTERIKMNHPGGR